MNTTKTKQIVMTALFAAMVCVTTAFILHIPVGNGYIHVGDSIVYLAACILPFPFGMIAGGIGGCLADLLTGYPIYAIFTLIIKALNAGCFYLVGKSDKLFSKRNILATLLSSMVTIFAYYFTAVILYGGFKAQLVNLIPNSVQASASAVLFLVIAYALDKAKIPALNLNKH